MPPTVRGRGRHSVTFVALWIYALASVVAIAFIGLPRGRQMVFAWVVLGLFAASAASPLQGVRDLIRDWLPLFVVLATYDQLRGIADNLFTAHTAPQLYFDQWLFAGHVPTVWLQQNFFDARHLEWWDYVLCVVYMSHFVAPIAIAGVLWVRNRARYRAYAVRIVALSYVAFVTYVVFPAVPPWMASNQDDIAATVRTQREVWKQLGFKAAENVVSGGSHVVNDVAAVPSLHAAFPALFLFFFWSGARRCVRVLLVAYTLAMGFALVYGAEHWVFDVLLGWAYAGAVVLIGAAIGRWREKRRPVVIELPDDELDLREPETTVQS